MNIINIKNNLHDKHILKVLALSQYMPTEKMNQLTERYETYPDVYSFSSIDGNIVAGVIILKCHGESSFEIMSIATDPAYRKRGVASSLIAFAVKQLKCAEIYAETDDDAVNFYRKYGFEIIPLGMKYPGIERYMCRLNYTKL